MNGTNVVAPARNQLRRGAAGWAAIGGTSHTGYAAHAAASADESPGLPEGTPADNYSSIATSGGKVTSD